jgi:hypothetical protein
MPFPVALRNVPWEDGIGVSGIGGCIFSLSIDYSDKHKLV